MTVREVFATLSKVERDCLVSALQAGVPKHIELSQGRFIGVNVQYIQYLQPTESDGPWSIGVVKGQKCDN